MITPEKCGRASKGKPSDVTLEEALEIAGFGRYNYLIIFIAGLNANACLFTTFIPAMTIPATDCDLHLTNSEKGLLSTMVFSGMIFTSHFFGYLADEYGRKYVALRCNILSGILSFVSAFCPNFTSLAITMFLNGAIMAGVLMPAYVYVGENVQVKYRSLSILLCGSLANTGAAVVPALALLIIPMGFQWDLWGYLTFTSWRLVFLASAILPFLGAMAYPLIDESPKYLLTKGFHQETLEILQRMYSSNTGKSKEEFPVKTIRLDLDDAEAASNNQQGSLRRMWGQTCSLFRKPLLKLTLMSATLQAGLYGACNMVYLWVPQLVTEMMNYEIAHPEYGVTLCQVVQSKGMTLLNATESTDDVTYINSDLPCKVNVPVDMFIVSIVMGTALVLVFMVSGALGQMFGNRKLLVTFTFICAGTCFGMTMITNMWLTIIIMAGTAVLLEACMNITTGIVIEFFPTSVRSMASCICVIFGRITTSLGTMVMGITQERYCDISYWGLAAFIICIAIMALVLPEKKSESSKQQDVQQQKRQNMGA